MKYTEIPVLLLTGYLGSGKTTLLNRILSNRRGIRFAVIVNDIGEVNIDASLIQKGGVVGQQDDSLVALQNGCICCTLKMDLVAQIRDLLSLERFDYIVIEASGICEPEPIAQTICSIPSMGEEFTRNGIARLDCIATVVDALRLQSEFGCGDELVKGNIGEEDLASLVIQQIEFCNLILLNKASEVTPQELARIRQIIRAIQPKAEIIDCDYCDVDFDKLLNTGLFDFEKVATSATWISAVEKHIDDDDEEHDDRHHDEEEHEHHHHDEQYGIGAFVYYRRRPLDINRFDHFIAKKWPKNVIRTKGICYFSDQYDKCYLFEQAGKQISLNDVGQWYATMPQDELLEMLMKDPILAADWDPTYGDRMQKLVFIGQHIDKEELGAALDACLVM